MDLICCVQENVISSSFLQRGLLSLPPKKVMAVGVGAVEKEKEDLPRTLLKAVEGWMVL